MNWLCTIHKIPCQLLDYESRKTVNRTPDSAAGWGGVNEKFSIKQ